jgi:hypothetical protein
MKEQKELAEKVLLALCANPAVVDSTNVKSKELVALASRIASTFVIEVL